MYVSIYNPYIKGNPPISNLSIGIFKGREIAIKRESNGEFEFKLLVISTYKKIFGKNPSKLNMPTPCNSISIIAEWDNLPDFNFKDDYYE